MVPVVFLHGIRMSGTMWRPVASRSAAECRLPDFPGHGRRSGEGFTMDAAVEAVREEVEALGGRAFLAGVSMGGFIGMEFLARHPGMAAGFMGFGCTSRSRALHGAFTAAAAVAARNSETVDRVSEYLVRKAVPGEPGRAMIEGGMHSEVLPDVVREVSACDPLAALRGYGGPVWFVNGERDHFRSDEREFAHAARNSRLVLVPRAGHLTVFTRPRTMARLVDDAAVVASQG
ncbi:alpha/beta fold hydrolase [Salininema proteolyticum]|uniref:Alpha/beta fold hydrolase n=1 Tax=Salininema proteolyticum TaxID=1607685 RepID=A0ABV8U272_9ACTN